MTGRNHPTHPPTLPPCTDTRMKSAKDTPALLVIGEEDLKGKPWTAARQHPAGRRGREGGGRGGKKESAGLPTQKLEIEEINKVAVSSFELLRDTGGSANGVKKVNTCWIATPIFISNIGMGIEAGMEREITRTRKRGCLRWEFFEGLSTQPPKTLAEAHSVNKKKEVHLQ